MSRATRGKMTAENKNNACAHIHVHNAQIHCREQGEQDEAGAGGKTSASRPSTEHQCDSTTQTWPAACLHFLHALVLTYFITLLICRTSTRALDDDSVYSTMMCI